MSRRRRRVCVVTGSRAEYGVLRTVMRAIDEHPALELQLIVTGMHMLKPFGRTIDDIRADNRRIRASVRMQQGHDDPFHEAEALGHGIEQIARKLRTLRSDIVLVVGDRFEPLAGVLAALSARLIIAHCHGGDRALGDVDDSIRHAITKLAHVHLVATKDAAQRVKRLGEEQSRIYCVGAPGIDDIRQVKSPSKQWLSEQLGWDDVGDFAIVVQHPCGQSARQERDDMRATLLAVADVGLDGVVIYPNSDPGHSGIIEAINRRCGKPARRRSRRPANGTIRWFVARSLPRETYLRLLRGARVLVGNSSSGIIESATAGTPAVNVGPRQQGRLRCGPSVIDADYGRAAVARAIRRALRCTVRSDKSIYGDGRSGPRIASVLGRIRLDPSFRQKLITF
jgi:GDP/UDP-N,N'-diacetylbacillosamine 2-epimerase (hydrolysing)